MRTLEEILDTSPKGAAFSNGTSWEMWASRWCEECVNDIQEDCPLILAGFLHVLPQEWIPTEGHTYECTEFEPREDVQ